MNTKKNRSRNPIYWMILASLMISFLTPTKSSSDESKCRRPPREVSKLPSVTTSEATDLKIQWSWSVYDPESCVVGLRDPIGTPIRSAVWTINRSEENVLITAEVDISKAELNFYKNLNVDSYGFDLIQSDSKYWAASKSLKIIDNDERIVRLAGQQSYTYIDLKPTAPPALIWGFNLGKNQALLSSACSMGKFSLVDHRPHYQPTLNVVKKGTNPIIRIEFSDPNNCVFGVNTGPLKSPTRPNKFRAFPFLTQAEAPFWAGEASAYFSDFSQNSFTPVRAAVDLMVEQDWVKRQTSGSEQYSAVKVLSIPDTEIKLESSMRRTTDAKIQIESEIDLSTLNLNIDSKLVLYFGIYYFEEKEPSYVRSGWTITYNSSGYTARYSKGGSIPGGRVMRYETHALSVNLKDLLAKETSSSQTQSNSAKAEEVSKTWAVRKKLYDDVNSQLKDLLETKPYFRDEINILLEQLSASSAMAIYETDSAFNFNYNAIKESLMVLQSEKVITCKKGKKKKRIQGISPKCPRGYKRVKVEY